MKKNSMKRDLSLDVLMLRNGAFQVFAWQLVFVLGMVLGFLRFDSKDATPRVNPWLLSVGVAIVVYLFLQRHGYINAWLGDVAAVLWLQEYRHIARDNMAWMRLLNFLATVYLVAGLIAWHQRFGVFKLLALPGRWLAFLGQHSLNNNKTVGRTLIRQALGH